MNKIELGLNGQKAETEHCDLGKRLIQFDESNSESSKNEANANNPANAAIVTFEFANQINSFVVVV